LLLAHRGLAGASSGLDAIRASAGIGDRSECGDRCLPRPALDA
jgi:hypothetical protein